MRDKRKRIAMILFFVTAVIIIFCVFSIYNRDKVKVLRSDSWFDEFYVEENKVYIKCQIAIQNSGNEDKYVNLSANMEEDVKNGLLKSPIVFGYDDVGNNQFFIPANSEKEYEVYFIGDFAGNAVKQDRNLPLIDVNETGK